ncbi:MAG TPA: DRTGG domain-containing protein [Bacillota bacterium]|nr:DRTGG domain-containing protein [Bacillota bacterium]
MTPKELAKKLDIKVINAGSSIDNKITTGVSCDLLSWVMANGKKDSIWITVQTHLNIIAVASLLELSCILISHDSAIDPKTIEKAKEEGITLLVSKLDTFQLSGKLFSLGIGLNVKT